MKDYQEIAQQYAKQQGYDTVWASGERDGFVFRFK